MGRRPRRDADDTLTVILIDSSAWIEFLRNTGSPTCEAVDHHLAGDIAITDAVSMEVLAGARDSGHVIQLRRLLARATVLETNAIDFDDAAALFEQHTSLSTVALHG